MAYKDHLMICKTNVTVIFTWYKSQYHWSENVKVTVTGVLYVSVDITDLIIHQSGV